MTDEQMKRFIEKMGPLPTSVGEPCMEVNGRLWKKSEIEKALAGMTTESKAEVRDIWDDVLNGKISDLRAIADWAAVVGYGLIRDKLRMVIAELAQIKRMRGPRDASHEQINS